jgi:dihydroflavonol-4-reductase
MSAASDQTQTVLVTGGSGYLGSWIIVTLLRQGFRVRTTIRSLDREVELRNSIAGQVGSTERLDVIAADLLKDDGWARAAQGSDYVIHVASPMPVGEFKGQDIMKPAREGTRRVLEAATNAGARRIVMTSSAVAALPPNGQTTPLNERNWTERPAKPAFEYARVKTLAEQDAWEFARSRRDGPELTTVLPGFIQGPVMGADYSASVGIVALMLRGKMPAVPRIGFRIVDVRDLADLHVRAMVSPAAAGERFVATGDFLWLSDFAQILRDRLGERAAKAKTWVMPDWLAQLLALVSSDMASLAPDLGVKRSADASKAERVLGWKTRPAADSIAAAAESLIEKGLI